MPAGSWTFFTRAKHAILSGRIDFSGTVFKAHLFTSDSSISASDTVSTVGSLDNQLAVTRGYAAASFASPNLYNSVNNWLFSCAGVCWSANGGNLGSTAVLKYIALVASGSHPICFATLSANGFAVATGSALKINGGAGAAAKIFELA